MNTYRITRDEIKGLPILATGYKAIKWDCSTNGDSSFRYGEEGESLIGTVWEVDGDLSKCNWGLHFSKDSANVFNFYEPLGYNRYFKVNAYKEIKGNETEKTVAKALEFVEEYNLMEFIEITKAYNRNTKADGSTAVGDSTAVRGSTAVGDSTAVRGSTAVRWGTAVSDSTAVSRSTEIGRAHV